MDETASRETGYHPGSVTSALAVGCLIQCIVLVSAYIWLWSFVSGPADELHRRTLIYGGVVLSQWILLLPLIRLARVKGYPRMRLGFIISATFGALLGTACGGLVFSGNWK